MPKITGPILSAEKLKDLNALKKYSRITNAMIAKQMTRHCSSSLIAQILRGEQGVTLSDASEIEKIIRKSAKIASKMLGE